MIVELEVEDGCEGGKGCGEDGGGGGGKDEGGSGDEGGVGDGAGTGAIVGCVEGDVQSIDPLSEIAVAWKYEPCPPESVTTAFPIAREFSSIESVFTSVPMLYWDNERKMSSAVVPSGRFSQWMLIVMSRPFSESILISINALIRAGEVKKGAGLGAGGSGAVTRGLASRTKINAMIAIITPMTATIITLYFFCIVRNRTATVIMHVVARRTDRIWQPMGIHASILPAVLYTISISIVHYNYCIIIMPGSENSTAPTVVGENSCKSSPGNVCMKYPKVNSTNIV